MRFAQEVAPAGSAHAQSDPPAALPYLAGPCIAPLPTETPRAFVHAAEQLAGRERHLLFGVLRRLVAPTQFDRVEFESVGEFVHGTFQCQQADRLAGAAAGIGRREVECNASVPGHAVSAGIQGAGGHRRRFAERVARRAVRPVAHGRLR